MEAARIAVAGVGQGQVAGQEPGGPDQQQE